MNLGPTELIILLVIILVVFGGSKIPQLARGLGEGIKNFKEATREDTPKLDSSNEEPSDRDSTSK